jgi:two-component system alkaline phosphatase synthesis response regulator PhoP
MKEPDKRLKLLVADDEKDIVEVTAKRISDAGYDVVIAYDGEDAWKKIQSELPDIVLLDVNMPHMTGFEVLKMLRENAPRGKWIPVIILSARRELDDMQKGYDLEADHYLAKPCGMEDIFKAVKLMASLIPQHKSKDDV